MAKFTYEQKTGNFFKQDSKGNSIFIERGYSGFEEGKNNPTMETVHNVGPIPRGNWIIHSIIQRTPLHGPLVLPLEPAPGTETFGRSGFLIHGDSIVEPGKASQGCIILSRDTRIHIGSSGDSTLEVI